MLNVWSWVVIGTETIGAFTMIALMQVRTRGATFKTHYGRCLWARRIVYALASGWMSWHATTVLAEQEAWNPTDAMSVFVPVFVLVFMAVSHILNEQKWLDRAVNPLR